MELEKNEQMNVLFNFYSELLTNKQKEYMSLYYIEDFSLGEIAEQFNVSRQAVYDNLKRSEESLKNYENKLKIVSNVNNEIDLTNKLVDYIQEHYSNDQTLFNLVNDLNELLNR